MDLTNMVPKGPPKIHVACRPGRDGKMPILAPDENPADFAGDIIETDEDLAAKFNRPGMPPRFERLPDEDTAPATT
jgi:hypothetical protein